jgi:RecJ-like exonuclease
MKNTASILLLAGMFTLTACGDRKAEVSEDTTATDSITQPIDNTEAATDTVATAETQTEAPVITTVRGKVTAINQGKDGYTAELKDDAGKTYFATISIPNLDDPKGYRAVKVGDVITVHGESWKMENELHIKATKLE